MISEDIEGIVCLTAVMHIILVINKGWLNFLWYRLGHCWVHLTQNCCGMFGSESPAS